MISRICLSVACSSLIFIFSCLQVKADSFDDWVQQRNMNQFYDALNAIENARAERERARSEATTFNECRESFGEHKFFKKLDLLVKYKIDCDNDLYLKAHNNEKGMSFKCKFNGDTFIVDEFEKTGWIYTGKKYKHDKCEIWSSEKETTTVTKSFTIKTQYYKGERKVRLINHSSTNNGMCTLKSSNGKMLAQNIFLPVNASSKAVIINNSGAFNVSCKAHLTEIEKVERKLEYLKDRSMKTPIDLSMLIVESIKHNINKNLKNIKNNPDLVVDIIKNELAPYITKKFSFNYVVFILSQQQRDRTLMGQYKKMSKNEKQLLNNSFDNYFYYSLANMFYDNRNTSLEYRDTGTIQRNEDIARSCGLENKLCDKKKDSYLPDYNEGKRTSVGIQLPGDNAKYKWSYLLMFKKHKKSQQWQLSDLKTDEESGLGLSHFASIIFILKNGGIDKTKSAYDQFNAIAQKFNMLGLKYQSLLNDKVK